MISFLSHRLNLWKMISALLAGALLPLSFSPFDYWLIAFISPALIFMIVRNIFFKEAAIIGFFYGFGLFGAGISWVYVSICNFGPAHPITAILLTILLVVFLSATMITPMFVVYGYFNALQVNRNIKPWHQALAFSSLWVLFELLRGWLFTGFPWLYVGYALIDTTVSNLALILGVHGLSFIALLVSSFLVAVICSKKHKILLTIIYVIFIGCGYFSSSWLAAMQWTQIIGNISFSAIQGNISQYEKWEPTFIENTINRYQQLTENEWDSDLIIWPENSIPLHFNQASPIIEQLNRLTKYHGNHLILGLPIDDNSETTTQYFNSMMLLGATSERYDKHKLVPFGEYVPWESMIRGLIAFFDMPMSSFSSGKLPQPLFDIGITRITPSICYEIVYPDFNAKKAQNSGLLVNISNDTWFGESIGPFQHLQMARMRALETGRFMIRVTNSGITALINSKGKIEASLPMFQHAVLRDKAGIVAGATPFMNLGSWPIFLICIACLLMLTIRTSRKEQLIFQ